MQAVWWADADSSGSIRAGSREGISRSIHTAGSEDNPEAVWRAEIQNMCADKGRRWWKQGGESRVEAEVCGFSPKQCMETTERFARESCLPSPRLALPTLPSSVHFSPLFQSRILLSYGLYCLLSSITCSYPKDSDKQMLAKQTGLTRSQVLIYIYIFLSLITHAFIYIISMNNVTTNIFFNRSLIWITTLKSIKLVLLSLSKRWNQTTLVHTHYWSMPQRNTN